MRSIRPDITFGHIFIAILFLLIIITYLSEYIALHFLSFIVLFAGGSSNKKVFLFFIFLLTPLLAQYIFKNYEHGKHFLRYTCFFLIFNFFLYILGAYMLYSLSMDYNVSPFNYFVFFEDGRSAGIIGNLNNNQILKPVMNILTDLVHIPPLLPAGYRWIDYFFPPWVFYLSSILLLISFYFWTRMGIELIENPVDLLLASLPSYGLFVTTIDGGFFTPFAMSSMGAFLSFMVYKLYEEKSFRKILVIIAISIIPPVLIPCVLLIFSINYLFLSHVLISLMYGFLIATLTLTRYEFYSEAISEKIIDYHRRFLRLLRINLSEKTSRFYIYLSSISVMGFISLCLFIICISSGYAHCGLMPESLMQGSKESNFVIEAYKQEFLNMSEEEISEFFIERDIPFLIRSRDGPHVYGELSFDESVSFHELRRRFRTEGIAIYPRDLEANGTINVLIIPDDRISEREFNDISQLDVVSHISRRDGGIFLEVMNRYHGVMDGIYRRLRDKRYFLVIFL